MFNSFSLAVRKARRRLCMWRADSILLGLFFYHQRGRHRLSVTTKTGKGEIFGCKILEAKDPGTVLSD